MKKAKTVWIALLSGCFLLLAACSTNAGAKQDAENMVQAPEKVYMRHCANCHGGNLQGGFGPALTGTGKRKGRYAFSGLYRERRPAKTGGVAVRGQISA
ncbi:c-type cytochrome [Thermoactinomyces mirandus]|uniref:Cytochrome c n=1 Tax=Thermoactinomyces mirandus TaxID=2756294 RepID=A0A7W1XRF5_9BACL|nr:cytochrome c [Thermoactinomyces mirandus]MBA4601938.1 cytochrome c [Thermoactinomyces mirandus]